MSTPLNKEQQFFFEELTDFGIPDSIAVIVAVKTDWQEIITWDEHRQLKKLATLIWQTGLVDTSTQATKMAQKIKKGGLNTIYDEKERKPSRGLAKVGDLLPDIAVDELAKLSHEEMTVLWLNVRAQLEAKLATTGLSPDENNYLVLATFYST